MLVDLLRSFTSLLISFYDFPLLFLFLYPYVESAANRHDEYVKIGIIAITK